MKPEHWLTDANTASVAVLNIPGLLSRPRVFDVDATLLVSVPETSQGTWLELTVDMDGQRQWRHRISANNPGQTDTLEYHQRVRLDVAQGIRIRAVAVVKGVRIQRLLVEAREEL